MQVATCQKEVRAFIDRNKKKTLFKHGNFDEKFQYIALLFFPKDVNYNITNKLLKYIQVYISILNMNILNIYEQNRNDKVLY